MTAGRNVAGYKVHRVHVRPVPDEAAPQKIQLTTPFQLQADGKRLCGLYRGKKVGPL